MKIISVQATKPYAIYIASDLLYSQQLIEQLRSFGHRFVIISDNQVAELIGRQWLVFLQAQGLKTDLIIFPAGEMHKTRETKQLIEDELFLLGCQRDTVILALGGGVVTDMAGFVAATYYRGVPAVYFPTTLLAMVDASIGGKTAVDTSYGKNLIGVFSSPHAVFIDPLLLHTLPERELKNGSVEMIKHALISDADLFFQLQQKREKLLTCDDNFLAELIEKNCLIKKAIVQQDETDQGIRQLLNFGHTIGHAIENLSNYQVHHGEAVAMGIILESFLSVQRGYLSRASFTKIQQIILDYKINLKTDVLQNSREFWQALTYDKKAKAGQIQVVMLDEIGRSHQEGNNFTVSVTEQEIINLMSHQSALKLLT